MDEKTRRPLTWIIIVAVIVAIVIIAIYRRTELDRLANTIAYGSPAQRIQAVRALVAKQKLMEALEDRPRWVMDNAVAAIPYVGDNDAYFEPHHPRRPGRSGSGSRPVHSHPAGTSRRGDLP